MSDQKVNRDFQIQEVSKWWNLERNDKAWSKNYNSMFKKHGQAYLKARQQCVLEYVDELDLEKDAKVLELGFGGGQTALLLGKRGLNVYGLDISKKLCDSATKRCEKAYPEGKYNLMVGNIESNYEFDDNYFDAVIVVGALQYLHSPNDCFKEVYRVLKTNGHFIVAQKNIFSFSQLSSFRYYIRSLIIFICREEYEIFPSFKSFFVDSRLGLLFKRFEDRKIFNTRYMLVGHDVWKYKIKKRVYSYRSLKHRLKNNNFIIKKKNGAYYPFSEKSKYFDFNIKFDHFIQKIVNLKIIPYLFIFSRCNIFLAQKKD